MTAIYNAKAPPKAGWRPKEWGKAAGDLSLWSVHKLIRERKIRAVNAGHSTTIILTQPAEYLATLPDAAA